VHCVPLSHLCTLLLLPPPVRRATHAGVGGGEDRVWASERRRDETSSVRLRSVVSPGLTLGPSVDSRRSTCASVIFSWLHQATVTGAIDSPARLNIGLYEYLTLTLAPSRSCWCVGTRCEMLSEAETVSKTSSLHCDASRSVAGRRAEDIMAEAQ
jgi:hypothetical protein